MSQLTLEKIRDEINAVHTELARKALESRLGKPSVLNTGDILESHPIPIRPKTWEFLRKQLKKADSQDSRERIERLFHACADLAIHEQVASLADMLNFYMERGRMHVAGEKVPALEVVPWLQAQADFDKREAMLSECVIFNKGIINPMLLGMLELTIRTAREKFGFSDYASFCEAKKGVDFSQSAHAFENYLEETRDAYHSAMKSWAEDVVGRPFAALGRFHALYLLRIRDFDGYFPVASLRDKIVRTFQGMGFDLAARPDISINIDAYTAKNPDAVCIGVEIPGEVHVLMKPVGGLIDVETLLHEVGHAFYLSHFDRDLPLEYRRLYRSTALDEAFAFLFMELIENPVWQEQVGGLCSEDAARLTRLSRLRRLCLVRRYIGKFLAELELHRVGDIKNAEPYCRRLHEATGFVYEPEGYLVDMEPDFYSFDYLWAWAGAYAMRQYLESEFGHAWFQSREAGDFLKTVASTGRQYSLDETLTHFCGIKPELPDFSTVH